MMALFQSDLREGRLVEGIEILIGVCVVVAIVLVVVVVVRFVRRRSVIVAAVKHEFQLIDARQVYRNEYEFTTSISAQRVIDGIEKRWGGTVPNSEAGFYVKSVIEQQQVILVFGNQNRARIFDARIDFESRDPASGTLSFFDAEDPDDGTEAAEQLRSDFARLIDNLSPGSFLQQRHGGTVILTWRPEGPIRSHRRLPRGRHKPGAKRS